jgi:hypothetical protein
MTVKELIELLQACNQNSKVYLELRNGIVPLIDEDVYQDTDKVRIVCTL